MKRLLILALILGAITAESRPREFAISQTEQVTRGLVAYWSMRNSGTTVYDEKGENNGTASGVTFSTANGVVGNGGDFDGTNDHVTVSDAAALSFGNGSADVPFSISAWAWIEAHPFHVAAKAVDIGTGAIEWLFGTRPATGVLRLSLYDDTASNARGRQTNSGVSAGQWLHVAVTYDGASGAGILLYLNGTLQAASDFNAGTYAAMDDTASDMTLGVALRDGTAQWSNGKIDDLRIYNVALTADEIKQLYRMGATIFANR